MGLEIFLLSSGAKRQNSTKIYVPLEVPLPLEIFALQTVRMLRAAVERYEARLARVQSGQAHPADIAYLRACIAATRRQIEILEKGFS